MSSVECEFVLEYQDEKQAKIIKDSLEPDNEDFISIKQEGNKLIATAEAKTPEELLHTVDDFLACLSIAEETVENF